MHVRLSAVRGMPVIDDETQETVGLLSNPLIDADVGRILGFFVALPSGFRVETVFLSVLDITAWGTRIHIRSADKLSPPDELIRLKKHLDDPRRMLGQPIRQRGCNRRIGVCRDVQFDTRHFTVEWLFPRGLVFFKQPIPVTEIAEVTDDAVWILDPLRGMKEKEPVASPIISPSLPEVLPTVQGRSSRERR